MKLDRTPDRLERKGWRDLLWCWLVINNYLPPLSALLAVQRPTSSLPQKKKKRRKNILSDWPVLVTGHFQEFVFVSDHRILSNSGFLPGSAIHWVCAYTHMNSFRHTANAWKPAHIHITWKNTKLKSHTLRIQQRGLIGGGRTGGIPSYVLSTNHCRQSDKHVCNRIPAAHCVPAQRRKKEGKKEKEKTTSLSPLPANS